MNGKRSKQDEQFEQAIENFIKNKSVSIPVFLGIIAFIIYNRWEQIAAAVPLDILAEIALTICYWLIGILFAWSVLLFAKIAFQTWYNRKHFTTVQILPHIDDEPTPEMVGEFMRRVHGARRRKLKRFIYGKEYFTFTIHYRSTKNKGNQYVFYLGAPADRMASVKSHMRAFYPRAEFLKAKPEYPDLKTLGVRMDMQKGKESTLALSRHKKEQLPGIMEMMEPGTWLQVAFSADNEIRLKKKIIKAESKVKEGKGYRERNAFDREEEKSFKSRFYGNEVAFNVLLSVASESYAGYSVSRNTADSIAAVMEDVNGLVTRRMFGAVQKYPIPYPHKMTWTGSEMAKLFHLPNLQTEGIAEQIAKEIPHGTKGMQSLPYNVLADKAGFAFGELVHPLLDGREVRLSQQALGKQWGLTGRTGSGKSTILAHVLNSFNDAFIRGGHAAGYSFFDPKKETATVVLNQLMKAELDGKKVPWEKVHWISFKNAAHPPAMNLLYRMPGVPNEVLVDQILRIIRENNPNQAAQAERLLKKCIETLLADKTKEHTILGVRSLLLHRDFLLDIMSRLKQEPKHAGLVDFWQTEAEDLVRVSAVAIQNRLDIFHGEFMSRIFGQPDFNFPIRKWMDEGHLVFYDFSGMGEEEIGLIGSYLSYLYYRVADTRPDRSLLHQFVIDEAQRVKASILPEIHREMRSKGLSLGISTQTMDSLAPELQGTLTNVVANMFVCQQGQKGAKVAAEIFRQPGSDGKDKAIFTDAFLMSMPELQVALKTEDKGKTVFCLVNVPYMDRYLPDGRVADFNLMVDKVAVEIEASNEWTYKKAKELEAKNGRSIKEIDEYIKGYIEGEVSIEKPKLPREEITLVPNEQPVSPPTEFGASSLLGGGKE